MTRRNTTTLLQPSKTPLTRHFLPFNKPQPSEGAMRRFLPFASSPHLRA